MKSEEKTRHCLNPVEWQMPSLSTPLCMSQVSFGLLHLFLRLRAKRKIRKLLHKMVIGETGGNGSGGHVPNSLA